MNGFISRLGLSMDAMLDYREALGFSRKSYTGILSNIDSFLATNYPDAETLTLEAAWEWLNDQCAGLSGKASVLRILGKYLVSTGKEAYVLPGKFIGQKLDNPTEPYIFSDEELRRLFTAADRFPMRPTQPFLREIVPVMFRLIYTCGLRPNEGRELLRDNINFNTGEILITNTKRKKDRTVVMSLDMLKLAQNYEKIRVIFSRNNDYFFPSWEGCAFSSNQIGCYFRECWKLANPGVANLPNVRVYDLRHRFASAVMVKWLESGQTLMVKLPYLRTYMGHGNLSDTLYYVHLLPENLIKSSGIDWVAFDKIMPEHFAIKDHWRDGHTEVSV